VEVEDLEDHNVVVLEVRLVVVVVVAMQKLLWQ
jgi:hypothetical protein